MKRKLLAVTLVVLLVALVLGTAGTPAGAEEQTLEEQIATAITNGLVWLADQQKLDGSWGDTLCDRVGRTGLAVLKFETYAIEQGMDPLSEDYVYSPQVANGLAYIMANAHEQAIGLQPAGDPDGDGDGIGLYFTDCPPNIRPIYNTGIAMMALAASGHPELYEDPLQDAVDYMAWAQADDFCGPHRGGWRYVPDCNSDNSNTGYVTLGLGYAAAPPPYGFGLTIPQFVKDELSIWIDLIQDDVDGDDWDGGSWYDPWSPLVNILKTGNLIYEMALVGDTAGSPRVQDAIDYIQRHWDDPGACGTGWTYHRQAMFTMMKGFEGMGIELIDLDGDDVPEYDWFVEVAQHLVDTQNADGSWPGDCWGEPMLSTAWALITLERSVPTVQIPVALDVHPTSCPNPLNVGKAGVVPMAVLGTDEFDVTQIDPATVRVVNLIDPENSDLHVAPLRWALEDVATPFEPLLGKEDCVADCWGWMCDEDYPGDGYMDLTFKFRAREITAALGEVADGDCLVLRFIGNLQEDYGGTPFVGEDVVWIIDKSP